MYRSYLYPVILEKLLSEIRLIISRNCTNALCDFARMLELINNELKAREPCILSDHLEEGETNDNFAEYTSFALLSTGDDRNLKSKYQFSRKCIFCKEDHWSDRCNIITYLQARKEYVKNSKLCFRCFKRLETKLQQILSLISSVL